VLAARIVATRIYEKRIAKLLPPDERTEMENAVAADPERYPVVGKSGGIRLIYYFWVEPNAVVLITAYAKNEKENLTDADKKEIRKIVENLKRTN
jgi:mRNA-degrading endonuclease RelE of RelBE toxin-antitoxin system